MRKFRNIIIFLIIFSFLIYVPSLSIAVGGTTKINVDVSVYPAVLEPGDAATLTVTVAEIGDDDAVDVVVTPIVSDYSNIVILPSSASVSKIPQGSQKTFEFRVLVPNNEADGSKSIKINVEFTDPGVLSDRRKSATKYVSLTVRRPTTYSGGYGSSSGYYSSSDLGALFAVGVLLIGVVLGIVVYSRRKNKKSSKVPKGQSLMEKQTKKQKELMSKAKELFPSELLKKYEPLEFIGEGGFAKVFKVKRKSDGKVVAVKIPNLDEKAKRFFLKEAKAWRLLDHPNIVKLYGAYDEPLPYLEIEYVDGIELNGDVIRDLGKYPKPVDEKTALNFIIGIAEGLKHAHSKQVFHRDLKPQNILLTSDVMPKITDWGLAKVGAVSTTATTAKGLTLLYAAPEQLDDETYGHTDARTDIYQLGLVFYELLTGKLPYTGTSPAVVMAKVINPEVKPKPPSHYNKELSKYDRIFEQLLAKRKEERYQSVEEFLEDLELMKKLDEERKRIAGEIEKTKTTMGLTTQVGELKRLKHQLFEQLSQNALLNAQLNDKAGLINALEDIKAFSKEHRNEIENAISQFELMMREGIPIGESAIEELRVLLYGVRREVEG